MYKFIVTGWHAENYIYQCLHSIISQKIKNWQCAVVLDPSNDKTYHQALSISDHRIKVKLNNSRQYAIHNIVDAINMLNPNDDDILILVDADDWLAHDQVLNILEMYYRNNPTILLTHGSWQGYPDAGLRNNNGPYTEKDFRDGIRKVSMGSWRGSHLKTMKYKLYKHINQNRDFKDPHGQWLKSSYDLSLMLPAIEMAGMNRIKFIHEILYIYNRETTYNDDKADPAMQDSCTNYLMALPPYPLLKEC